MVASQGADPSAGEGSAARGSGSRGGSASAAAAPRPAVPTYNLARLTSEVGNDRAIVEHFVADYLALLEGRLERIGTGLELGDHERAVVALLGLESSSSMIGATVVSALARELLAAVRETRSDEVGERYDRLRSAAERLGADLSERSAG